MNESLEQYLSGKKIITFRNKTYYKVKNYKNSYYISTNVFDHLSQGIQEVELEKNSQRTTKNKGLIKWDPVRKQILVSESKIRLYFQPFEVE